MLQLQISLLALAISSTYAGMIHMVPMGPQPMFNPQMAPGMPMRHSILGSFSTDSLSPFYHQPLPMNQPFPYSPQGQWDMPYGGQGQLNEGAFGQGQMNEGAFGQGQMPYGAGGDQWNGMQQGQGQWNGMPQGEGQWNGMAQGEGQWNGITQGQGELNGMPKNENQWNGMTQGQGQWNGMTQGQGQWNGITQGEGQWNGMSQGQGQWGQQTADKKEQNAGSMNMIGDWSSAGNNGQTLPNDLFAQNDGFIQNTQAGSSFQGLNTNTLQSNQVQ